MDDRKKSKAQLIAELAELRKRNTELEASELVEIHSDELIRINEQLIDEINERKKTEETLQSKKDELQLILDSSPVMIFYKDREGRFILANEALAQALGKPKEEMEGRLLSELLPKDQAKQMDADDREVMESEKPKIGIIEAYESPEGTMWSRTSKVPLKDDKGDIIGIVGFGEDVTEWKKADKELRQKTAEQEVLLSSIPAFVYYKDTESRLIAANRAFAEMVNTPVDQLTGKTAYDLFPKEQAEAFHKDDKRVMESGKPVMNIEEQITDAEGRTKWASTSKIPYFNEKVKVIGMVGITLDITERKQMEEALIEKSELNFALFEYNPIETIAVDIEGRINNFNLAKKESGDRLPAIGDVMYRDYAGRHEIDMYTELLECIRTGKLKEFSEKNTMIGS